MVLVYKYGLAAPHAEYDRILYQMLAAHRYRNTLVEIERHRRDAERRLYEHHNPRILELTRATEAAEQEIQAALKDVRRERARTHKRSESTGQKQRLKTAKDTKRGFVEALRQARKELKDSPEIAAGRDRISELALGMVRGARALSGLARRGPHYGAWGTYQLVEEAAQSSFSDLPLYAADGLTPNNPRFLRWQGEGAVSVQIQGGASIKDVTGDHEQLHLTFPDERAWLAMEDNNRAARGRLARQAELSMCLGTDAQNERIYGVWRLDMHRPLPEGATIKRATVHRRKSGPHAHWSLELTIECPMPRFIAPRSQDGTIAIDIGWRQQSDGAELRVAGWMDTLGSAGEWKLDASMVRALRDPQEVRSRRDKAFDTQISSLSRWLDACENRPEWLAIDTASIRLWKSAARLTSLRNKWALRRFAGDEIAFEALHAWATADLHYWEQESRRRDASLRRRRDFYRVIARQVCGEYATIVLEQLDLRRFARRAPIDAGAENEVARSNRHLAALSELRGAIEECATKTGRTVIGMPAHDTTRTCPVCGLVEDRPAASSVVLTCECGAVWDQDVQGAAKVLLARWRERPGDAKYMVGARKEENGNETAEKKEGRKDRVKRMRFEKVARMRAAREAGANDSE